MNNAEAEAERGVPFGEYFASRLVMVQVGEERCERSNDSLIPFRTSTILIRIADLDVSANNSVEILGNDGSPLLKLADDRAFIFCLNRPVASFQVMLRAKVTLRRAVQYVNPFHCGMAKMLGLGDSEPMTIATYLNFSIDDDRALRFRGFSDDMTPESPDLGLCVSRLQAADNRPPPLTLSASTSIPTSVAFSAAPMLSACRRGSPSRHQAPETPRPCAP